MTGADEEFTWPPPGVETTQRRGVGPPGFAQRGFGQRLQGPRWIVSIRALVVVLAMLAAALGMLWLEAASVQGVSADLSNKSGGHVTVPPLAEDAAAPGVPAAPVVAGAEGEGGTDGATGGAAGPGAGKSGTVGMLVHVVGAVNNPGVFVLGEGSRIYQAVEAAGGALPTAQLAALNLAAPVSDGMQIVVLTQEQAASPQDVPGVGAPANGAAAQKAPAGPINVNAATAADLDALPGIGPVLAERIVAWRTDHGPFPSVDALDAVSGIGAKLLENIRSLVSVS
ncbi:helix-hairpin-helix domain-containing protein [Arthrobacter sp. PAMC 25486]|uniref:helix-hairpin-helix domain-containing protein n=1 Tax=Arthrobacter sp. PAMC 25486 TaxID=1494608 RepID=UPI0009DD1ED3|nr:helix-hairpin-helix domain-containing protein [Arthrobacter sp. PAMC 25486]